jgi:hypothetical protein
VSRYLATHGGGNDRVLVWGNVPEIYWASGTRPATRFIATNSLLAANEPGRTEAVSRRDVDPRVWRWFFRDLEAHPPRYIVDTAPAQVRSADRSPISEFPRLQRYIENGYSLIRTFDGFVLYQRT